MRKRPLILALLLSLVAAAPDAAKLGEHYDDPAGRFAVDYPARWTARAGDKGGLTVLTSPAEYKGDAFLETVAVGVETYADDKAPTLAAARSAVARRMKTRGAVLSDSDGRVTLAGRAAHRFAWILDSNGVRATVVQFLALDRGRLFVVTFTTQSGHEHIYRKSAQPMLDSFAIDPEPATTRPAAEQENPKPER